MISTNIDGSAGGTNQLFDLLALVSNPDAYKVKLDQLQKTIDENKKFIALVGPASDVLALRDSLAANTVEIKVTLADAKTKAAILKETAELQAKEVMQKANEVANQLIIEAKILKDAAILEAVETTNALKAAKIIQNSADKLKLSGESRLLELDTAIANVTKEQQDAVKLKASIIAAHQAFIAGL
jgi:hypothetical protein